MRTLLATSLQAALILALATTAQATTARLQVLHNAADPAAEVVDIYVNDGLFIDDFAFRDATPFVDVPAGVELMVGVAPGTSTGPGDIIASFPVTLEAGRRYVAVANGVLDPAGFAANPEGAAIAFTLFARDGLRERARFPWFVDLMAFHGVTDAPTVDVVARLDWNKQGGSKDADLSASELAAIRSKLESAGEIEDEIVGMPGDPGASSFKDSRFTLINDLAYGEFSGYRTSLALPLILDVTLGSDQSVVVASYEVDLRPLRGGSALVFASGFLNPGANQNGPAFGLFAALPDGTVLALEPLGGGDVARLQVVHNAADPAAEVVDVYVNDGLFIDDFAFRDATPFVDVPAGVQLTIGVAPGSSTGPGDIIASFPVTLDAGKTYVAMANGVLAPGSFAANPDGRPIGFSIYPRDGVREAASWSSVVDLVTFHGATDAPAVDIWARIGFIKLPLFRDLAYTDFSSYRSVLPTRYRIEVRPAGTSTVVAAFDADLRGLGGGAAVVFASGFLNPGANQNGPAFGLFAALPDGNVVELPAADGRSVPSIEDANMLAGAGFVAAPGTVSLAQNSPNPFNPSTAITFSLPTEMEVRLSVYDVSGREVSRLVEERMAAGGHSVDFDGSRLSSGTYYYKLSAGEFTEIRKMTLIK